jgi:hypothetical protein
MIRAGIRMFAPKKFFSLGKNGVVHAPTSVISGRASRPPPR